MTRELTSTLLAAMMLFGCGRADPWGLYASAPTTSDAGGDALDLDASGAPDSGAGAVDATSPEQEPESTPVPRADDPSLECKNDEECLPLVCNTQLGRCQAPGPAGSPCGRPVECQSGSCKKHECQ